MAQTRQLAPFRAFLLERKRCCAIKSADFTWQMHCGRKVFMALVLCTGVDPVLMKTRQLILQQAGHEVVTAIDEDAVKTACQQRMFDVAVIGQAASASKKRAIVALIRKHCASAK